MKNKILLFLTSFSLVLGSDMRIAALGGNAGFWPEDDQNIKMFPSVINDFNLAQIENASGTNPYATFIFGEGNKYGFMLDGTGDNLLNLAYGNGTIGAILGFDIDSKNDWNMIGDSYDDGMQEIKTSSMALNAMAGLNHDVGEIGFGLNFTTSDNDNGNDDDDSGSLLLNVNLRREQPVFIFSHLLASFSYGSGKQSSIEIIEGIDDYDTTTVVSDFSDLNVDLNLFRHWKIGSGTDLMFASGLSFTTEGLGPDSTKITSSSILFPNYTFAVETNLREWAILRAGVNNVHLLNSSTKAEGSDRDLNEMGSSETRYSVGLGFEYEGFQLDIDLNKQFFVNPVQFLTGFNQNGDLATRATITYTW